MAKQGDGYLPALDGIRAVAVAGVLYTHLAVPSSSLGHLGVRIFFVLSAFLITGILLNAKSRPNFGILSALKVFFISRSLRIMPPYYLLLVSMLVFGAIVMDRGTIAHLLFLSNYWFCLTKAWDPWPLAPLWSLAVEWQFYMIWPIIVLSMSTRWLTGVSILIVLLAGGFRIYWSITAPDDPMRDIWFPASVDALAVGSLLAMHRQWFEKPFLWLIATATLFAAATIYLTMREPSLVFHGIDCNWLLVEAMPLLPIALIIAACSSNSLPRLISATLGAKPLVSVGRVSYAVYLYHFPLLWGLLHFETDFTRPFLELGAPRLVVTTATAISVATASWFLLEKPMQRLRKGKPIPAVSGALAK